MAMRSEVRAVIRAASRLQTLVRDAVLVGGTAAVIHASHRISLDDDHVLRDLRDRFDQVLSALEETDGWITARVKRPVLILGRLDGIETGVRQLIRKRPLEVEEQVLYEHPLRVPTLPEIIRIKAWLCLTRNATRDYLDLTALSDRMGLAQAAKVLGALHEYYADQHGPAGRGVATQVAKQLAEPIPFDLGAVDLFSYRNLEPRWRDWQAVKKVCNRIATLMLDDLLPQEP